MVDFHSHILPNIDDGPKCFEESIQLLKEAKKVGFNKIVSTSHYLEGYYIVEEQDRKELLELTKGKLQQENIELELYLGNEIYIAENIAELIKQGKASSINNTNYILFELPINAKPLNLYDTAYRMIQKGLIPILAHPERYSYVKENPNIVTELIELGVLMQCNFASIIGYYGKRAKILTKKFLENDMVHFLGSDVHRPETIYPKIPQCIKQIENIVGKKKFREISEVNPELVLQNMEIHIEEPSEIKFTFMEKMTMKKK